MKYKEIKLLPTLFYLDVFITNDDELLRKTFNKFYGIDTVEMIEKGITADDSVTHIKSTEESKFKGSIRIVMILRDFDSAITFHEIIHVLFRLELLSGININSDSQEWVACMAEYIYNQYNINDYSTINE